MRYNSFKMRIFGYTIEAVLIFLSIFGAFLLEERRSNNFERKLLIGQLEVLLEDLRIDSLKFHDMYEDIDSEEFFGNLNLYEDIVFDSMAIKLILLKNHSRVYGMFENDSLFNYWVEPWTLETPSYESIISNYQWLVIGNCFVSSMESYFRFRRSITSNNGKSIELRSQMISELSQKYQLYDPFISESDMKSIIESPTFKNSLIQDYELKKELLFSAKYINQLYSGTKSCVEEELERQYKAL